MATQQLEIRPGRTIVIESPEGLIKISINKKRKVTIDLPGKMVAHRTEDRAISSLRFLKIEGDIVKPDYEVLVPIVDDDGAIVGVKMPKPIHA